MPRRFRSGYAVVVTVAGVPTDTREKSRSYRSPTIQTVERSTTVTSGVAASTLVPGFTVRAVTTPAIGDTTVVVAATCPVEVECVKLLWCHAEELQACPRALDLRAVPHVLGVDPLQLLLTGRADFYESIGARNLLFDGLELRSHREIARLRLCQVRTVDFHQRRVPRDPLTEGDRHTCDATGHERRDHHLAIGVGLHDSR